MATQPLYDALPRAVSCNAFDDSDREMHYPSFGDESAVLTVSESVSSPEANSVAVHVDVFFHEIALTTQVLLEAVIFVRRSSQVLEVPILAFQSMLSLIALVVGVAFLHETALTTQVLLEAVFLLIARRSSLVPIVPNSTYQNPWRTIHWPPGLMH